MTRFTTVLILCMITVACVPVNTARHVHTLPSRVEVQPQYTGAGDLVRITGNVYLRDIEGAASGAYLARSAIVRAFCVGTRCNLPDYPGLSVWRGCTSNNPQGLGCEAR